jgi:hypothetical protein
LLSADPYHGGYIIFASGQTVSVDANGDIQEDVIPNFNGLARTLASRQTGLY